MVQVQAVKFVCRWYQYDNGLVVFNFPKHLNTMMIPEATFKPTIVRWKQRTGIDHFPIQDREGRRWVLLPEWNIDPDLAKDYLAQEFADAGINLDVRVYRMATPGTYQRSRLA